MTRSIPPPRLALFFAVIAALCTALWLAAAPVRGAAAAAPQWQAVLVAGDDAQPVFDNAVETLARWLAGSGVPSGDIHRLSASPGARDPAAEPASAERILQRIAALRPPPGGGCLVFITSHGQQGRGIWLAYRGEYLEPASLAQALSAGCAAAPTVVILSSCYSGAFTAPEMRAPNRIILSAARADRTSFGCQADRTYTVFDECLLGALPRAPSWRAVYGASLGCVRAREKQLGVLASQPQASFGAAVRDLPVR
jgi:peptidase C13-like protein